MQCVAHGLQSKNAFTDPLLTVLILAAISFTAVSFQELASDLPYSKFIALVQSPQYNSIQSLEARTGVRDVLGGHTLFVKLKPNQDWKSVYFGDNQLVELSRTLRKRDLDICFVCGSSIPLFKALPNILLLILAAAFLRLGKILQHDQ